jgi:hypothetical protein
MRAWPCIPWQCSELQATSFDLTHIYIQQPQPANSFHVQAASFPPSSTWSEWSGDSLLSSSSELRAQSSVTKHNLNNHPPSALNTNCLLDYAPRKANLLLLPTGTSTTGNAVTNLALKAWLRPSPSASKLMLTNCKLAGLYDATAACREPAILYPCLSPETIGKQRLPVNAGQHEALAT